MNMKKVALGCLGVLVVLLIIGAGGAWWLWTKAQPYVATAKAIGQLADIDRTVTNKSSFTAPENGELTEDMVGRFVKVQEAMETRLGTRVADLKAKYDALDKAQKAGSRQPTLAEGFEALKDTASVIVEAKKAQVDALNKAGFSLAEYTWVRTQVYSAAGITLSEMNLREMVNAAQQRSGEVPMRKATTEGEIPERNKELVKPYAARLQEWMKLGFFGL
jgi:hypothetical protein